MAITILPREEGWGETIGAGVGTGIKALAAGKVAQMGRRFNAERFKDMGLDPNLAYVPEKFGLKALGETYAQRKESAAAQSKQREAIQEFTGLAQQAKRLGLTDEFIKDAIAGGPVGGTKQLRGMVKDLQRGDKPVGFAENWLGKTPSGRSLYKGAPSNTPLLDRASGVNADQRYFEDLLKAIEPTQSEKQQKMQEENNARLQQEIRQNPPKNTLDVINNTAAQDIIKDGQQPGIPTDPKVDKYREVLTDPNIPLEEKEALFEEMKDYVGTSALQKLSSLGVGALKGSLSISQPFLPSTLAAAGLNLGNFGAELAYGKRPDGERYIPSYENIQEALTSANLDPVRQYAIKEGFDSDNYLARAGASELAEMGGSTLPPLASQISGAAQEATKGTPLEKYVVPQSSGQEIAENIGELASFASKGGIGLAANVKDAAQALTKAAGSKAVGWATEKYTGSKLLGDLATNGAFLASTTFPGTFRGLSAKRAGEYEKNILEPAEKLGKKVSLDKYGKEWDKIATDISKIPANSAERKILEKSLEQVQKAADAKGLYDPKTLMNTSKIQSQNIAKAPEEAKKLLTDLVELQEKGLTDLGKSIDPKFAKSFSESNNLLRTAAANEGTRQSIIDMLPIRQLSIGAILSYVGGWPFALGSAGLIYGGNTMKNILKSPPMRSAFGETLKAAAAGNAVAVEKTAKKFDAAFKKSNPKLYNELEDRREEFLEKVQNYFKG